MITDFITFHHASLHYLVKYLVSFRISKLQKTFTTVAISQLWLSHNCFMTHSAHDNIFNFNN